MTAARGRVVTFARSSRNSLWSRRSKLPAGSDPCEFFTRSLVASVLASRYHTMDLRPERGIVARVNDRVRKSRLKKKDKRTHPGQ